MDCLNCSKRLVEAADLFFYWQKEDNVHLSVKKEKEIFVFQKETLSKEEIQQKKKKSIIKCNYCKWQIGCELSFKFTFLAFGCNKVTLCEQKFGQKDKWYEKYEKFKNIEVRGDASFYSFDESNITEQKVEEIGDAKLKFPCREKIQDFDWNGLIQEEKIPRIYQIEAFVRSLLTNLIVVLETGAGKTLIAAMFLKRMIEINDKHMGLLIVDRVPLVYQQADAIEDDTTLVTAAIHGGDKVRTAKTLKKLNGGFYNVLVITAGAFKEMISNKELKVDRFCAVVLDECHHTKGGHDYVDILKLFTDRKSSNQPRILGLTASPINATTSEKAENQLKRFLQQFPNTSMFYPMLPKSKSWKESFEKIFQTEEQEMFSSKVLKAFDDLRIKIEKLVKPTNDDVEISALHQDLSNHAQVIGELRLILRFPKFGLLGQEFAEKLETLIIDGLKLIECLETCSIMGIQYGCDKLKETQYASIAEEFTKYTDISPRLQKLRHELENEHSKILVFVSTRFVARTLTTYLAGEYPKLNVQKVVGRTGFDGQIWEGEQKQALDDFKEGRCFLLVSTSVLEEGLDVASCDLVVCFTGVVSLIRFIQCRGRARKTGSKFVVYESANPKQKDHCLKRQEEIVKCAVKQKQDDSISKCAESIIEIIKRDNSDNEDSDNDEEDEDRIKVKEELKKYDFSFKVYVHQVPSEYKDADIKLKLQKILEECREFELSRLSKLSRLSDFDNNPNALTGDIFQKETLIFLVGAKCRSIASIESYIKFCTSFSFKLDSKPESQLWTKGYFPCDGLINESDEIFVKSFSVGYYTNESSYCAKYEGNFESNMKFKETGDIILSYQRGEETFIITIPKLSLGNFALLSFEEEYFILSFHLLYPPILHKTLDDDNDLRLTVLNSEVDEVDAFAEHPVLFLHFNIADRLSVLKILETSTTFSIPYFNVKLRRVEESNTNENILPNVKEMADIVWSLKCLEDSRSMCYEKTTNLKLANYLSTNKKEFVKKMTCKSSYGWDRSYFYGFERLFKETYKVYRSNPNILDEPILKDTFLIKSVIVSPLRVIAMPAVPVASNRFLRKYARSRYEIIIVSFKDEDKSKYLHPVDKGVLERIKQCVVNGIEVCGTQYYFCCSTNSQLREHKAYFIDTPNYETVLNIRKYIIPKPEGFKSPSKYLSRLGLYGTADKDALNLSRAEISWNIDDLRAADSNLVTDGAGKISFEMAKKVSDKIGLINVPSAFQIRYSGVKGILVTTNEKSDVELNGKSVAIRESMIKFENSDESLSVVDTSKFYPLTLNREIINLLSSVHGEFQYNFNDTLKFHQEKALQEMAKLFRCPKSAKAELQNYVLGSFINDLHESKMEILDESYWFSILQGIYRLRIRQIQRKTNIPIKEGCLIMGIPDPYGILKEDEVFVQIKVNERVDIKKGPLLIFRNPCLHPGDVRRVKGIEAKELKDLVNVLVFPVKSCKMSLAAQCSGGDLDGDKYGVIWDKDFIPPLKDIHEPCNYSELTMRPFGEPQQMINSTDKEQLAAFFIKFILNDRLGRIANKHLALCDIQECGARDKIAIELSKAHTQAVDFPKTGIEPNVPSEVSKLVKSYPDFMGKSNSVIHNSKKILGELYRRCRDTTYDFDFSLKDYLGHCIHLGLIVEGCDEYFEDAAETYISYEYHMDMLMKRFDLKVEADVILGEATYKWSKHFDADKGKASNVISAQYKSIVNEFRRIFFDDVNDEELKWKKASAWYQVVNDPSSKIVKERMDKIVFKSFPWVVHDILCQIQKNKKQIQPSKRLIRIGESSIQLFKNEIQNNQLIKNVTEKKVIVAEIGRTIEEFVNNRFQLTNGFLVDLYGSTSIYVCEPDSDIDICVRAKPSVFDSDIITGNIKEKKEFKDFDKVYQDRHFLEFVISEAVDKIVSRKVVLLKPSVPLIKCETEDGNKPIKMDISMNEKGLLKTFYIHHLYEQEENGRLYLPLFWILVRWARVSGIVKSYLDQDGPNHIDTADFYLLVIHVLKFPKMELNKDKVTVTFQKLYKDLEKPLSAKDYYIIGNWISEFFRKCSIIEETNLEMKWPISQNPEERKIDNCRLKIIQDKAMKAFHCLSATRDVNIVLNYFMKTSSNTLEKLLPSSLSYVIGNSREFHATRLSEITGAVVSLEPKKGNILLQGKGSRLAIEKLQSEVQSLIHTNKALVLGRLPQKSSRYFMEGSSIVLSRHCMEMSAMVSFEDSSGPYHGQSEAKERSAIHLNNAYVEDSGNQWKHYALEKLRSHIFKQMERFPKDNDELLKCLEITCRFGCFHVLERSSNLPKTMTSMKIQDLQSALEKGRVGRKDWNRDEYKSLNDDEKRKRTTRIGNDERIPTVPLAPASRNQTNPRFYRNTFQQSNKKRGLAAVFSPGMFKNNTKDLSARNKIFEAYNKALTQCGFSPGETIVGVNRIRPPPWKACINPSISYEGEVCMDDELNVVRVAERGLNWVHGTIIDGRKQSFNGDVLTNPDIRLLIATGEIINERKNKELYQKCLPKKGPPIKVIDGKPVSTYKHKSVVRVVRNVKSLNMFTNGKIDASIVDGELHYGDKLSLRQSFCDLSLYFDPTPLINAIKDDLDDVKVDNLVKDVFEKCLMVKEALDEFLKSTGSNQMNEWYE